MLWWAVVGGLRGGGVRTSLMTFFRAGAFLAAAGLGAGLGAAVALDTRAAALPAGLAAAAGSAATAAAGWTAVSGSPDALWKGDGLIRRTLPYSHQAAGYE